MTIKMDGQYTTQQVKNKVTYKPPTKTQYNASYNESQRRNQAEQARRQAEAQRMQAQAQAYQQQQEQMRRQADAQRMQAQADAYKKQKEQMLKNQQRKPVTSNLVPQPLVGGTNYTQMGQNQFTPQMQVRNYAPTMNMNAQPDRWATMPGNESNSKLQHITAAGSMGE